MAAEIRAMPAALPAELLARYANVSFPTLGHYIEEGATSSAITAVVRPVKMVGRAITVRTTAPDSTLVHKVMELAGPGDVVVIDTGGNTRHAPVGEMVALAAKCRGCAGIVVDGPATDTVEIRGMDFPVFSRGTSCMTTKLYGIPQGGINVPVTIDDVVVHPGDLVLGDDNGVLFLTLAVAEALIARAEENDAREPDTRRYLAEGGLLPERSAANRLIKERFNL